MGNPAAISTGPGILRLAPASSAEPNDLVSAWPGAWVVLGYTRKGNTYSHTPKTSPVEVAEEFYPVKYVTEAYESMVKFELAENTATNLKRALNGGTIIAGAGFVTFTPPTPGNEVRVMIGFESEDGQERHVWRQCFQQGGVETSRQKGAEYAGIPCEFKLEKPAGLDPWKSIYKSPDRA